MDAFIVDALAAYRLTRLVTRDKITEPLREHTLARIYAGRYDARDADGKVIEFDSWADRVGWDRDAAPKRATLLLCPWCVGVWVGFGVMIARRVTPRLWSPVARALALGAAAGLVEINETG